MAQMPRKEKKKEKKKAPAQRRPGTAADIRVEREREREKTLMSRSVRSSHRDGEAMALSLSPSLSARTGNLPLLAGSLPIDNRIKTGHIPDGPARLFQHISILGELI